jgi:hypothetical protein
MKVPKPTFAAGVLAITAVICLAPSRLPAQELTSNDAFDLVLDHTVQVGSKTLQPGTYRFEPLNVAGGDAPVLVIRSTDGARSEISAQIVPTYSKQTQQDTRVYYHHVGNNYYFDRIWVKGRNFGYKFVLPKNAKAGGDL